jgi:hypothetical protein
MRVCLSVNECGRRGDLVPVRNCDISEVMSKRSQNNQLQLSRMMLKDCVRCDGIAVLLLFMEHELSQLPITR